jgi:hypothetical protein
MEENSRPSRTLHARRPALVTIQGDPARHRTHLREVAADPEHPEHTHRSLPLTRGECPTERPCQYLSCRHHMAVDDGDDGLRVYELAEDAPSCSLDVAADGEHTLEEIAQMLGITRERVRQIETQALLTVKHKSKLFRVCKTLAEMAGPE